MKKIIIVRHVWSGEPLRWKGSDRIRPIDNRGEKEADWLSKELAPYNPDVLYASEYLRCYQTLLPLSIRLRKPIKVTKSLNIGQNGNAIRLAKNNQATVFATHGDTGVEMLKRLGNNDEHNKKGSYWLVTIDGDNIDYRYVKPPKFKEDKKRLKNG